VKGHIGDNNRGTVTIGLRIEEKLLQALRSIAEANKRTVSRELRALIEARVGEVEA
jgi:hypothetical protein